MLASLLSAFAVGLLGGVHCVGMCGGIVSALSFGLPRETRAQWSLMLPFQLFYNLGRITSYVAAGALMGGLGILLAQALPLYYAQKLLFVLAGLIMIILGLYLGEWWFGLSHLEQLGARLWRRLEPLGQRLLPGVCARHGMGLDSVWSGL